MIEFFGESTGFIRGSHDLVQLGAVENPKKHFDQMHSHWIECFLTRIGS